MAAANASARGQRAATLASPLHSAPIGIHRQSDHRLPKRCLLIEHGEPEIDVAVFAKVLVQQPMRYLVYQNHGEIVVRSDCDAFVVVEARTTRPGLAVGLSKTACTKVPKQAKSQPAPTRLVRNYAATHIRHLLSRFRERIVATALERNGN